MEIFQKAFEWLASLSAKLPAIDLKTYFIVVVAVIVGVGVIIGLTFFGSRAFKLKKACKKIVKYLSNVDAIDDDNLADFVNQCFSIKAPQSLRDSWVEYLNVRFGFPSEIVSQQKVLDQEIKKVKDIRANVFVGIALILTAIFAFWGFGTLDSISMSVIHCAGLLLAGVGYLVLVVLNRSQIKKTTAAFALMQEELDVKVYLQVEKNYATDSSPLNELAAMVDEIVARNTSKIVDITDELNQEDLSTLQEDEHTTPIESLIAYEEDKDEAQVAQEQIADEQVEDVIEEAQTTQEEVVEEVEEQVDNTDEPQAEVAEEAEETLAVEEQFAEEQSIAEETEIAQENLAVEDVTADEQQEIVEDAVEEQETVEEVVEEPVEEETVEIAQEVQEEQTEVETQQIEEEIVDEQDIQIVDVEEGESEDAPFQDEQEVVEETQEVLQDVEEYEEQPIEEIDDVQEEEQEESVVYIVDGPEEDEIEDVKPAKLVKLPNLVNYIISKDFPQPAKMKIAQILIDVYKRYEDSPEDRKIAKECLEKYMLYLKN